MIPDEVWSSYQLTANYPTHVNPKSEAGNYDQAVALPRVGWVLAKRHRTHMLSLTSMTTATQAFVESIEAARKNRILKSHR